MVNLHHVAAVLAALFTMAGCDKHQAAPPAEEPAPPAVVIPAAEPNAAPAAPATTTATYAAAGAAGEASCGDQAATGGQCNGGCDKWDEAASAVAKRVVPVDARWEQIAVQGMVCGGCERRVIANLGELAGILAVEADAELGQVRVAMAAGADLRKAAVDRINALGYQAK